MILMKCRSWLIIQLTPNRAIILNVFLAKDNNNKYFHVNYLHVATGIPITTIKDNLYFLERAGVLEKTPVKKDNKKGRPKIIWSLV
jgi:Fe2+ or Zn2+ uptake regulation protein